jgi:hypothetical protein
VLDHDPLDGVDALEVVPRPVRVPRVQGVPNRLQLEQDFLEPELVGLVDDDEEEFVVSMRIRKQALQREQLGDPQVRAIGELAVFLPKPRARDVPFVDVAPPAEGRLGARPAYRVDRPA